VQINEKCQEFSYESLSINLQRFFFRNRDSSNWDLMSKSEEAEGSDNADHGEREAGLRQRHQVGHQDEPVRTKKHGRWPSRKSDQKTTWPAMAGPVE
jgi:hypothetical protein